MSADNILATLQLKDGYRIADIHAIWEGDEAELLSPYNKVAFSQSEHYETELEAEAAEARILGWYREGQMVLEYGTANFKLDMTWAEYLASPPHPRVECPVCLFAVRELFPMTPETPDDVACEDCINGNGSDHGGGLFIR